MALLSTRIASSARFAHPSVASPPLPLLELVVPLAPELLELVVPPAPELLDDVATSDPPVPASPVLPEAALVAASAPPAPEAPPCPSTGSGFSTLAEKTQAAAASGRAAVVATPSKRVELIPEAYQSASCADSSGSR